MTSKYIVLILGAGSNLGLHIAKHFKSHGFKIAIVSRNLKIHHEDSIYEDLADPANMKAIFEECRKHLEIPNIVIYNGKCSFFHSDSHLLYFLTSLGSNVQGGIEH
jgi:short-subunit dehydrogenase